MIRIGEIRSKRFKGIEGHPRALILFETYEERFVGGEVPHTDRGRTKASRQEPGRLLIFAEIALTASSRSRKDRQPGPATDGAS
jgi:hypothetical protein